MKREELVKEIVRFGVENGMFNAEMGIKEIINEIGFVLDDYASVDDLVCRIIKEASHCPDLDIEELKALILELEKIKLELKFVSI